MKELKFELVPMKDVPEPPASLSRGRWSPIWVAIKKLGFEQAQALRVPVADAKELNYARAQIREMAKRDGLRLLSSRNQDSTVAFFWAIKPGKNS